MELEFEVRFLRPSLPRPHGHVAPQIQPTPRKQVIFVSILSAAAATDCNNKCVLYKKRKKDHNLIIVKIY